MTRRKDYETEFDFRRLLDNLGELADMSWYANDLLSYIILNHGVTFKQNL